MLMNLRSYGMAGLVALTLVTGGRAWAQSAAGAQTKPVEPEATLKVGDKAPALVTEKWVKGGPLASFESGKVYVLEFWATWCGPCIKGMPHLSAIQREYGPRGVTIIGCTSNDPNNSLEQVEAMVKDKGDVMSYTVAWDNKERATNAAYMQAANQRGIPTSFVVDQSGRLAWIGHPMFLEFVLDPLLSGKWDAKTGAENVQTMINDASTLMSTVRMKTRVNPADALSDWSELESKYPNLAKQIPEAKLDMLYANGKVPEGDKLAADMLDEALKSKSAGDLLIIARTITSSDRKLDRPNLPLALRAAEKAAEFGDAKSAAYPETLARVHFLRGDAAKAVEFQTKAIALVPEARRARLEPVLAEYKKAAETTK
jgi:thiol-disulfide isomerase/thioredoxin